LDVARLITMANDIAAFFHGSEDPRDAAALVARHLELYWHPRMRAQLLAYHSTGGTGLSPLAAAAATLLACGPRDKPGIPAGAGPAPG
jgi:formate dehydrogenase subunit delta